MSGYRIDQDQATKAGMREAGRSGTAGIDSYMTDGNYNPVDISAEGLKDIVDHVMGGLSREAKRQQDYYAKRGRTSGTIDEKISALVKEKLSKNLKEFKVGDKVTYLGHPGEITGINKEMTGDITYNVDYDKGEGRTTVTNVWFKSGDIEPLNGENEFSNINESKLRSAIRQFIKEELVGEVDSRFKEMQKEPHDHKWVQIDKDGTQECKICGLRRSNSFFKNRRTR